MPFSDYKTALVTGASSGIGAAVVDRLCHEGLEVHALARSAAPLAMLAERTGCIPHTIDVSDTAALARLAGEVAFDVLVNNAAEQHERESLEGISAEQLERTFRTNVFGYFFMTKAALPHLKEGAAIVNTTSVTAYQGSPQLVDYAATRGAIVAFTRSMSEQLVERGIRVNAVAPGPIWTPLIPASFDEERTAKHGGSVPMKRAGEPNEVATCHLFLACADASYMSGQVLHPNGGKVVGS